MQDADDFPTRPDMPDETAGMDDEALREYARQYAADEAASADAERNRIQWRAPARDMVHGEKQWR